MLGGAVEVVSSNPAVGDKYFSVFSGIVDLLYLSIYTCIYIETSLARTPMARLPWLFRTRA